MSLILSVEVKVMVLFYLLLACTTKYRDLVTTYRDLVTLVTTYRDLVKISDPVTFLLDGLFQ